MSKLLTPAQAAEFLGVAEQTLANWRTTKRYQLAYTKVGRKIRYRQEELERFVAARTVSA